MSSAQMSPAPGSKRIGRACDECRGRKVKVRNGLLALATTTAGLRLTLTSSLNSAMPRNHSARIAVFPHCNVLTPHQIGKGALEFDLKVSGSSNSNDRAWDEIWVKSTGLMKVTVGHHPHLRAPTRSHSRIPRDLPLLQPRIPLPAILTTIPTLRFQTHWQLLFSPIL